MTRERVAAALALLLACAGAPASGGGAEGPSALADSPSPYLREHAGDLVRWRPWGEAAFAEARARDLPVLLLSGYASCHWCHVMGEESFRDPEIAALLNARFVPVVVDREERPDVDAVHLRAVQALTGKTLGWPLVAVLGSDGAVLFGSSYLPARDGDRGAAVGFLTVMTSLADRWAGDRAGLLERGAALARDLSRPALPGGPLGPDVRRACDERLAALADREHGGFGGAPKFPRPSTLDAWLAHGVRDGDPFARDHVLATLDALARSALRDPVDGGFHRYAVDAAWAVPHFEKPLTENAQLGRTFLDGWRLGGDPAHAAVVRETAAFLATLRVPGGLASGLDADSPGPGGGREEGAYYLVSSAELGELWPAANAATDPGAPRGPLAPAVAARLAALRSERPPPARDDKVVSAWQGEAMAFLSRAGRELGLRDAAALADALAAEAERRLPASGLPPRAAGSDAPGLLDDAAGLAEGFLERFLATGDRRWLLDAERVVAAADAAFAREDGGHWRSLPPDPPLPVRPTADEDGPTPAASAVLARTRLRIADLRGDAVARNRVSSDLLATSGAIRARPASHAGWLQVAAELDRPPPEIVLVWPDGSGPGPLADALWSTFTPGALELALPASRVAALAPDLPLLAGKDAVDRPTAYVCTRGVCQAPAHDPAGLRAAITAATAR